MNRQKIVTKVFLALLLCAFISSAVPNVWKIFPAYAANSWTDGFESGDGSGWTSNSTTGGSTITIVDDPRFRGTYSANCTNAGSESASYVADFMLSLNASNTVYARGYFYMGDNVLPFEDTYDRLTFITFGLVGSDYIGSVQVEDMGTYDAWALRSINGQGYVTYRNATPIPTEATWWCIEFYTYINDVNGAVGMWVNGTQVISQAGLNTTRYGNINKVHMGVSKTGGYIGHNCTVYVDSCAVSDSYIGLEPPETTPQEFYIDDDFEGVVFPSGNWTGEEESSNCNVTRQATTKHLGSYATLHEVANTTTSQLSARLYRYFSTNYTTLYWRGYFMFGIGALTQLRDIDDRIGLTIVAPTSGWDKSAVYARNISNIGIRLALSYLTGASSSYAYSDVVPVENVWYCIESAIFVNDTIGWSKLWINGVLKVNIQGINNTRGTEPTINRLRLGSYMINGGTAHQMNETKVYMDDVKVSNQYIGTGETNPPPITGAWAIFSEMANKAYITSLFSSQGIAYVEAIDTDLTNLEYIESATGLVIWYDATTEPEYNITAVQEFAKTKVVICDLYDFAEKLYPALTGNIVTVNTGASNTTETFLTDYGSKQWSGTSMFHTSDVVSWHWGNGTNSARCITTTALSGYSNITYFARRDTANTTLFQMNGTTAESGFYCMDFFCLRSSTLFNGLYQLLPAIWNSGTSTNIGQHSEWLTGATTSSISLANMQTKWSNFVSANKDIMNETTIGLTEEGRNWNITIIGFGDHYLMADAAIHGGEKLPVLALYRFMEELNVSYRTNGIWATKLNEVKLILVPIYNPDGYITYGRENKNGVNLNRDAHETNWVYGSSGGKASVWYGNFSQLESQHFKAVVDAYQPVLYLTFHEGREWEKNVMYYTSSTGQTTPSRDFASRLASAWDDYWYNVYHLGYYTDYSQNYALRTVDRGNGGNMIGGSPSGYETPYYPAHQYDAVSFLVESFCWSGDYQGREQLYATDYYTAVLTQLFLRFERDKTNSFMSMSTKPIESANWSVGAGTFTVNFNNTGYASVGTTVIYVGTRGKPIYVRVDGQAVAENVAWTWSATTYIVTVVGSSTVELAYLESIVTITIVKPGSTSYAPAWIPVELSASGGVVDKIWWNCKNGTSFIYGSNQTYTIAFNITTFTIGVEYIFYAWANNTDGSYDEATVAFTVIWEAGPRLEISLNNPDDGYTTSAWTVTFTYTPTVRGDKFYSAELWLNLSGIWQVARYNSTVIANATTNTMQHTFYTNNTYVWNVKIWNSTYGVFAGADRSLTAGVMEIDWYMVDVDCLSLDSLYVDAYLTKEYYNSSILLTYIDGQYTLRAGTYTVKARYLDMLVNETVFTTAAYGNSTLSLTVNMKALASGGFLAVNKTATITLLNQSSTLINATISASGGFTVVSAVPLNASLVQLDGVNVTDWFFNATNLSLRANLTSGDFSLVFPMTLGDPWFGVTVGMVSIGSVAGAIWYYRRLTKKRSKEVS